MSAHERCPKSASASALVFGSAGGFNSNVGVSQRFAIKGKFAHQEVKLVQSLELGRRAAKLLDGDAVNKRKEGRGLCVRVCYACTHTHVCDAHANRRFSPPVFFKVALGLFRCTLCQEHLRGRWEHSAVQASHAQICLKR